QSADLESVVEHEIQHGRDVDLVVATFRDREGFLRVLERQRPGAEEVDAEDGLVGDDLLLRDGEDTAFACRGDVRVVRGRRVERKDGDIDTADEIGEAPHVGAVDELVAVREEKWVGLIDLGTALEERVDGTLRRVAEIDTTEEADDAVDDRDVGWFVDGEA